MNLRKWIFFLCVYSLLCVLAFWHTLRPPLPIRAPRELASAHGNPGWNTDGVYQQTADLFKKDDYAGLEKLVGEIKSRGYDIRQTYPELSAFYSAFGITGSADEHRWLDQQTKLEGWMRAYPYSPTAKIVMADWYIGYAWRARGTGFADTVTQEGWELLAEYLAKAANMLKSVPPEKVDDPQYYRLWLVVALGQGWSRPQMEHYFKKGTEMARDFFPLYSAAACFLLPKWYGNQKDCARFAAHAAASFSGEKGEILYALLAREDAHEYDDDFFTQSFFDYGRVRNAFLAEAEKNEITKFGAQNNLCYLASIAGDKATAKTLFLDLGYRAAKQCFGGLDTFLRLRKATGAQDSIDHAMALEQGGNLAEAEKTWLSFHPDAKTNTWLKSFYVRQGMEAKLRESTLPTDGKTYAEILDTDVAQADPNVLANQSRLAPQLGLWDKAEAAAQAFNQKRPWNVTGKITLLLCALHRGDQEQAEAVRKEFVALKTDRPAYQAAQAVFNGRKTWAQARGDLKKGDQYLPQATTAIALYYLSQGKHEEAHTVLREALLLCRDNDETLLESLLFGSLSRSLGPAPETSVRVP